MALSTWVRSNSLGTVASSSAPLGGDEVRLRVARDSVYESQPLRRFESDRRSKSSRP